MIRSGEFINDLITGILSDGEAANLANKLLCPKKPA
jgi:hypothetical protein